MELRPPSLGDLIASDHRMRLVRAFCEALHLGPLYRAIKAVEGRPGRPAADPRPLRPDDTDALAAWRARTSTDDTRDIYKQRATTAERVDAQARDSGLTRFLVRGIDGAKAVASWYGLANNMACTWHSASA